MPSWSLDHVPTRSSCLQMQSEQCTVRICSVVRFIVQLNLCENFVNGAWCKATKSDASTGWIKGLKEANRPSPLTGQIQGFKAATASSTKKTGK